MLIEFDREAMLYCEEGLSSMDNKFVCHDLPANEYAYSSNPPGNKMTGWYEGVVVAYSLRGRRQTRHPPRLSWPIKKSLIPGVVTDKIYWLSFSRSRKRVVEIGEREIESP